jgi:hypothetical protein
MRQDKTFARIFLIFSVANVALAAPAVVRQRHLDVAKAASEKWAPGPGIGSTDASGTGSPRMPPFEHYTEMWLWANSLENSDHSPPGGPGPAPESSSAAANRIVTTQAQRPTGPRIMRPPVSPESSVHSSEFWPDPSPPPHLSARPGVGGFLRKYPGLGYLAVVGAMGSAIGLGYGIDQVKNQEVKNVYVSPLSPLSPADIFPNHKHIDL